MTSPVRAGEVTVSKQSKVQAKLQRALETPSIYRITRGIDAMDRIDGFVVGLGRKWALIAQTMDGGYSDGLIAVRVRDILTLKKDRSFETHFAMTQPQPTAEDLATIDLDRMLVAPPRPWHRKQRHTPEADLSAWRIQPGPSSRRTHLCTLPTCPP